MGKRHRERRKLEKKLVRMYHYREDEFGNRKIKITKAEARRRFLRQIELRKIIEAEIIERATRAAHDAICAAEDARIVKEIIRDARGIGVVDG